MYFVLMILVAFAVAGLVLWLEHRGDPRALEMEYRTPERRKEGSLEIGGRDAPPGP